MTASESNRHVLPISEVRQGTSATAADIRRQTVGFTPTSPLGAPPDAPNVLIILVDDMGFGSSSAFGGPITMPAAERLAANGLRYTRFHTTALCSPTRQALLTGRNHHSAGMGNIAELATAAPGYTGIRPRSVATLAQMLRYNGYSTGAFGKWHQTPPWEASPAGPFDRWPTGEGFEKFYGFLGGEANQYYPSLFEGTQPIDPPRLPEDGYHLSEDLVDRAIDWVRVQQALAPSKPFFCYLAFGACHAPLQVPGTWMEKYRGAFDHGWERQREMTLASQQDLGLVPRQAVLPAWLPSLPRWDQISDDERRAACRLMELYAGFAEHMDFQVSRLVSAYEQLNLLDSTVIFYVLGDNGASAEGGFSGTTNEFARVNGYEDQAEYVLAVEEKLGGPQVYAHYPAPWAYAMDAPYQWTKQVASHYGGTRNGLIVHWPVGIEAKGDIRHQWHHVIDIVPSVIEAAQLPEPTSVDGVAQKPIEGSSMLYSFDSASAPDRHTTQYFEMLGNRGIYHEGWVACARHKTPWQFHGGDTLPALSEDTWELYDTNTDWTQAIDVAADHRERLQELQELFVMEAARYNVLPMDDRGVERMDPERTGRPNIYRSRTSVTYPGSIRQLPEDCVLNLRNRSHRITAAIIIDSTEGSGVIVAQGGSFGGWSLYFQSGLLTYCNNVVGRHKQYVRSTIPATFGEHVVGVNFRYEGGGVGRGGDVELTVDEVAVGDGHIGRTTPVTFSMSDTFNVGRDRGTPVSGEYPAVDNAFEGTVAWVRLEIDSAAVSDDSGYRARAALITH
jgi:arylsulfatase A-like enzyme